MFSWFFSVRGNSRTVRELHYNWAVARRFCHKLPYDQVVDGRCIAADKCIYNCNCPMSSVYAFSFCRGPRVSDTFQVVLRGRTFSYTHTWVLSEWPSWASSGEGVRKELQYTSLSKMPRSYAGDIIPRPVVTKSSL